MDSYLKLKDWRTRINRIVGIMRPSAERPLAAGEKTPDNPVNPVKIKIIKIESVPLLFIN
jgi:hypothetical protein